MKSLVTPGSANRNACGMITRRSASAPDMPSACAASICAARDRLDAGAVDLGLVGGVVQAEAEDRPRRSASSASTAREAVVETIELQQHRRAAEQLDVGRRRARRRRAASATATATAPARAAAPSGIASTIAQLETAASRRRPAGRARSWCGRREGRGAGGTRAAGRCPSCTRCTARRGRRDRAWPAGVVRLGVSASERASAARGSPSSPERSMRERGVERASQRPRPACARRSRSAVATSPTTRSPGRARSASTMMSSSSTASVRPLREVDVRLLDAFVGTRTRPAPAQHVPGERVGERARRAARAATRVSSIAGVALARHEPLGETVVRPREARCAAERASVTSSPFMTTSKVPRSSEGTSVRPVVLHELGAHARARARARRRSRPRSRSACPGCVGILEDVRLAALHVGAPAQHAALLHARERVAAVTALARCARVAEQRGGEQSERDGSKRGHLRVLLGAHVEQARR